MQFRAFEPGIEVYGPSIDAIIEGFSLFPTIALEKLAQRGIGEIRAAASGGKSEIIIDRTKWYSQEKWLAAFEDISQAVGSQVMFKIGCQVPKHAPFPPTVTDIHSGIKAIDIAYHMNHRKNGRVMFDPTTGNMLEGIGHYAYEKGDVQRKIFVNCKNPYPCDLDRGIVQTIAHKFEPTAQINHEKGGSCRKRGQDNCIYAVVW